MGSCANPIPPSGGPKDETPPQVIDEISSKNGEINFTNRSFQLVFDEWIKLNKVHEQVIISPPLIHRPNIKTKGKSLVFEFHEEEVLHENTTYTIQFGEAVRDLAENNPALDLKFVFSTGDIIDSLDFSGKVLDIMTGKGMGGLKVMLYDELQDSIPLTERPVYVSRTNEEGAFKFSNLRSDTFRLIAINDENSNYLFDRDKEAIAFLDTFLVIKKSGLVAEMMAFEEVRKPKITRKVLQADRLILAFDRRITSDMITGPQGDLKLVEWMKDSVVYWLPSPRDSAYNYLNFEDEVDTLLTKKARKARRDTNAIKLDLKKGYEAVLDLSDTLFLKLNLPVVSIDTALISLSDTSGMIDFDIFPSSNRRLGILADWQRELPYQLIIQDSSLTGVNGKLNRDSVDFKFTVPTSEKLGNIVFKSDGNVLEHSMQVNLLKGEKLIQSFTIPSDTTSSTISVPSLSPGNYEIDLIYDLNGNGKWDTGRYLSGLQPERRVRKKLEPLRENWDLNVKLEF